MTTIPAAEYDEEVEADPRNELRTGDPVDLQEPELQGGTQGKRYVTIGGTRCLAKPAAGDAGDQKMVWREAAASAIANAAGWNDLIAPTVVRNLDLGNGRQPYSVQKAWKKEANPSTGIAGYSRWDVDRAAVLDIIMDNGDRSLGQNHLTNWEQGHPRLRLVDHGHAFGKKPGPSAFVREALGRSLDDDLRAGVQRIIDGIDEVQGYLGDEVTDQVVARANHLLSAGSITMPPTRV